MSAFEHEGQFLIAGNERPLKPEATRYKIGPMFVDIFRGAKAVEAYDRAGQPVGLFIGTLIDTDREAIIDDRVVFDAEITSAKDIDQFVEQQVYRFAGTFLFILAVLNQRRIYLDANGSRSVVYDPLERIAAATTSLFLDARGYQERFLEDL